MKGIRLKRRSGPIWVELHNGARLRAAPPSTPMVYAARAEAALMLKDLLASGEAVSRAGGHIVGLPDLTSKEALEAQSQALFIVALAEIAVFDWEHILDDDGTPMAAFDGTYLAQLMAQPTTADAFLKNYLADQDAAVLEGNG